MDSLILIIAICFAVPLLLSLKLLDKKARRIIASIIIGVVICVFASQVNGLIRSVSDKSLYYITTNYTPIVEEICKAIPILLFAIAFSDDKQTLISLGLAVGCGFAIMENIYIFAQNDNSLSILWAVERVFGASLMHGLSTAVVGYGISFMYKKRKLFYTGTFAMLLLAIVFHSVYNSLVQSSFPESGLILTLLFYIPVTVRAFVYSGKKPVSKIADRE